MARTHTTRFRILLGVHASALVCVVLLSGGCGAEAVLAPAMVAEEWELIAIGSSAALADPQLPTVRFAPASLDRSSGAVTGRAPCNQYSGTYRVVSAGRLRLDGFMSTDMSCGAAADQLEAMFLAHLGAVSRYEYRAGALLLVTASNDSLHFRVRPAP